MKIRELVSCMGSAGMKEENVMKEIKKRFASWFGERTF